MPSAQSLRATRSKSRPDEYLEGVPNQDLTDEDYQALSADQRKAVRESGLWHVKSDAELRGSAKRSTSVVVPEPESLPPAEPAGGAQEAK